MQKLIWGITLSVVMAGSANAALISRAGGQAYYDDMLNITWLTNANLAASNSFGVTGINIGGAMTWAKANEWIAAMNAANHLGVNSWRLPFVEDTGPPGCDFAYSGTDCGYNVQTMSGSTVFSEMAHLYYVTLGNLAFCTTGASCPQAGWGLTNTGPFFANLQPGYYWSGTTYATGTSSAWYFYFNDGSQSFNTQNNNFYAWAVSPGDVLIPAPGALWLFVTCVVALGARLKRRAPA